MNIPAERPPIMDYLLSLTPDEAAQAVGALPVDEQQRVAHYLMAEFTVLSQQLLQQPSPPKAHHD